MTWEFFNFIKLSELDLSLFNTNNVTNMVYMISICKKLHKLNLSSFNIKNVTNMSEIFKCYYNLSELNLSSFNINKFILLIWGEFSYYNNLNKILIKLKIKKINK